MSEESAHQVPIPWSRPSVVKELLGRQRLTLVLTVFLIELTIFFLAASVPLDAATQQLLQKEAKGLTRASSSSGPAAELVYIFTHNTVIAFGEMVPVVGSLLWAVSIYATGQIVQAVASSHGAPGALYGLFLLFFPFALVELAAYAVAVSSGVTLIIAWRQRRLRNEVKMLVLEGGVVATMLLAAAAMETVTITDPTLGITLWIPTGLTIAVLALISSRLWH